MKEFFLVRPGWIIFESKERKIKGTIIYEELSENRKVEISTHIRPPLKKTLIF